MEAGFPLWRLSMGMALLYNLPILVKNGRPRGALEDSLHVGLPWTVTYQQIRSSGPKSN